mgnify:CR=1 FL=1
MPAGIVAGYVRLTDAIAARHGDTTGLLLLGIANVSANDGAAVLGEAVTVRLVVALAGGGYGIKQYLRYRWPASRRIQIPFSLRIVGLPPPLNFASPFHRRDMILPNSNTPT